MNFDELDPFEETDKIRKIVRRMMQTMWHPREAFESFPVDISDGGDELILKADLLGFEKGDIRINVLDNRVDISAKQDKKAIKETETMYLCERRSGAVRRVLTLPETVDTDRVEADFRNGVLILRMKKKQVRKGEEIKL